MVRYFSLPGVFLIPLCIFVLGMASLGSTLSAASYDYYVKEGGDGDGSQDDPFGSIAAAIDAVGDDKGKKIYISSGSYGSVVTIPKETTLVGADAKTVTLTGKLTLEDGVELEKIGFSGSGNVLITKNAKVTLEKLRFKDINREAIKTEPGNAVVKIQDITIENARKGMYLQAGTRVEIENIEVLNGREEGIDIRENVSGFVRQSTFRNNAESGIEIILGNAVFTITDNTFFGNGASGVAAQFFDGASKLGNVKIENNTFTKNDYGVDCKAPQGNLDSKFYYLNSLSISQNTYKENRDGDIANTCRIMTDDERAAFEAEEAKRKELEANRIATLTLSEAALRDRLNKSIEFRKHQLEKYATEERARLEPIFEMMDELVTLGSTKTDVIGKNRMGWKCYLVGSSEDEASVRRAMKELEDLLSRLEEEKFALRYQSNRVIVDEKIAQLKLLGERMKRTLDSPHCQVSLLGWVHWLLGNRSLSLFPSQIATLTLLSPNTEEAKALFLGTLSYYPKVREVAMRSGDERLMTGIIEKHSSYKAIMSDLRLPLGDEADPLPPFGANNEYYFPVRFSNIFAGANMTAIHLSNAAQIQTDPNVFRKTVADFVYAGIPTLGRISSQDPEKKEVGEAVLTTWLGEKKLHWVDYRESSGSLPVLRETLALFKEKNEPAVVVMAWDERQGKVMGPKREELLREIVKAGAALVIGTGLVIPYEQKTIDNVSVYTSLGSAFEKFQIGDTSKKSVALEIGVSADGKLSVTERNLAFTTEKGLELQP